MTMGEKMAQYPGHIQFTNPTNDYQYETFMSYNNISNHIVQKGYKDMVWELKGITTHEEPIILSHYNYKVDWCNVTV